MLTESLSFSLIALVPAHPLTTERDRASVRRPQAAVSPPCSAADGTLSWSVVLTLALRVSSGGLPAAGEAKGDQRDDCPTRRIIVGGKRFGPAEVGHAPRDPHAPAAERKDVRQISQSDWEQVGRDRSARRWDTDDQGESHGDRAGSTASESEPLQGATDQRPWLRKKA